MNGEIIINRMRNYLIFLFMALIVVKGSEAQKIEIPGNIDNQHPRIYISNNERNQWVEFIKTHIWAQDKIEQLKHHVAPYLKKVASDSTWLYSRLQMYWHTHHTQVFVKSGVFDHASGQAPVPTVRYTGARGGVTAYYTPRVEDVRPFMDDPRGLYLQNRKTKKWEWVKPSKTGRIIENVNLKIMEIARDAAFLYWYTGEDKYAALAYPVFDTYMRGMFYRQPPVDMNHGHDQTLLGLSSYEVIHDEIIIPLTLINDFLYGYFRKHHAAIKKYAVTFQKWCDQQIRNGVPFNNWDIIQARYIAFMALSLDDNEAYDNGKGTGYYLNKILNESSVRQWSLRKVLSKDYDIKTGIWYESPGYALSVINWLTELTTIIDHTLNIDLFGKTPMLNKATAAIPQYLYPNGYVVGFGDGHYERLSTEAIKYMILNAQKYHKQKQEVYFTRLLKMVRHFAGRGRKDGASHSFMSLFYHLDSLDKSISTGRLADFTTQTFYAPNVSWFVQRSGTDPYNGLMISEAGSLGNHAHANGIAMELYGKGLPLAPESGKGTSYFQTDYAEYYSQFPAHNTVVVDGISSYPAMKSHHPFKLLSCYPASAKKSGYFPKITFSDVYFLEPETNSDQRRMMSIIRTGPTTGYYVDVFRSRKKEGGDIKHEYIYHNLGQKVTVFDKDHHVLNFHPTQKLTFAQGDLMSYDYFYDKREADFDGDFEAIFQLNLPKKGTVFMNMWMEGFPGREIFAVKAPRSTSFRGGLLPPEIEKLPLPTLVVRQKGAAWNKPFVAIYEPGDDSVQSSIEDVDYFNSQNHENFAGIVVENKSGSKQWIFTNTNDSAHIVYEKMCFQGTYGVISKGGNGSYLFLGNGKSIGTENYMIQSDHGHVSAALSVQNDRWYFTSDTSVHVFIKREVHKEITALEFKKDGKIHFAKGRAVNRRNGDWLMFNLPALPYTQISPVKRKHEL